MMERFEIANYRGFSHVLFENLTRVNVLVGKNNAGKSSLLEALYLYSENFSYDVFRRIAVKRGEMVADVTSGEFLAEVSHFFKGHDIKMGFSMEFIANSERYVLEPLSNSRTQRPDYFIYDEDRRIYKPELGLAVRKGTKGKALRIVNVLPFVSMGVLPNRLGRFGGDHREFGRMETCFISPDLLDYALLVRMWNRIITKGLENEVVEALKILSPDVTSVQFLLTELSNYRYASRSSAGILVGLKGNKTRVPLGSLGDGMRRLLAIVMALLCSEKGYIFIDEIDVGFHYSVMADIWRLVVDMAARRNTQVFISTHSLDCLRGLARYCSLSESNGSDVSLFALHSQREIIMSYTGEEIYRAVENEIEVRG